MNFRFSAQAVASVAYKELLHIVRDWRILILLALLPPVFTLIFGYAFEAGERTDTPALLRDADNSPQSLRFREEVAKNKAFKWMEQTAQPGEGAPDLLRNHVVAALVIPHGWGASLTDGDPQPLQLYLDGADTNTADELNGRVQQSLGDFQLAERQNDHRFAARGGDRDGPEATRRRA